MEKSRKKRVLRIIVIIIAILIISPLLYLAYDRSLMPPAPTWTSPPYVPGETWEHYATRFLATSKKPNALEHYLKAITLYQSEPMNQAYFEIDTIRRYGWTKPYPKAKLALQANSGAIQEIILGAQMKQCELPPNPYTLSAPVPNFLKILYLTKLITANGKKYEQQKQPQEALEYYLHSIQFGQDLSQKDQPLLSQLISISIIQMNTHAILQLIPQSELTEKDYHLVITEMGRIEREQTSFAEALESDNRICYAELYQVSKNPIEFARLMNRSYLPIEEKKVPNAIIAGYTLFNRGRIFQNHLNFYNEMFSTITTKSYYEYMKIDWKSKAPRDFVNRRFLVTFYWEGFYPRQMIKVALLRLAQIQAAIHLYHLEKKQWPKSQNELKSYFKSILLDPFNDEPFLWSMDSSGKPFAYSVGPDFKDDSAKIVYDPSNGVASVGDVIP